KSGPAVGLDVAGAFAAYGLFGEFENQGSGGHGQHGGGDGSVAGGVVGSEQHESERPPQHAIAGASGNHHPAADPHGRAPAVDAAHQQIVGGGETRDGAG